MATAPSTFKPLPEISREVANWVAQVAGVTQPDRIHWCDGSPAETARLRNELIARKELAPLNDKTFPDCYLAYSHPSDVARVEHLTFICTSSKKTLVRTTTGCRLQRLAPKWMPSTGAA